MIPRTAARLSRRGAKALHGTVYRQSPAAVAYPLRTQSRLSPISTQSSPASITQSVKRVKLTAESYPQLRRDDRYAKINPEHVQFFTDLLGPNAVINGSGGEGDLDEFNVDWMRKYRGQTTLALKPGSTQQVSQILKFCNDSLLAVVPQGGNTGLVGGSIPVFDEIVISLSRMNQIRSFDAISGAIVVDAGCVLEIVDNYLRERDYIFPLDLGAKGSCQIGGNIATNAGGLRVVRYGSLHGTVLGLEAVLADGTIIDDLSTLRKNNTGYDLKQLFIGAEGTLGIITGVSVLCSQKPAAKNVALFGLKNFEQVQTAFRLAKVQLSEILSAFELMDSESQTLVRTVAGKKNHLTDDYPFYCLIETSGSNADHDAEKLQNFLEHVLETGVVEDGVLAQDDIQIQSLWSLRESIPECLGHWGGVYKYDLSIPIPELYELVEEIRQRLNSANLIGDDATYPAVSVVGYGHMGDSNLHLNVAVRFYDKKLESMLEPFVYEWTSKRKGSISAEHGLGIAKNAHVGYSRSMDMLQLMSRIKDLYDPNGILMPYKYFPPNLNKSLLRNGSTLRDEIEPEEVGYQVMAN